jgi:hypothetical protein
MRCSNPVRPRLKPLGQEPPLVVLPPVFLRARRVRSTFRGWRNVTPTITLEARNR